MKKVERQAVAVFISDIHYSINTLSIADNSLRQAIDHAYNLQVPLFIAGDMHDTKANLRGECANALIKTFQHANNLDIVPRLLVGNHCKLSEKSSEHSLNFLAPYAQIYDKPGLDPLTAFYLIPYQSDPEEFKRILTEVPDGHTIIMHQGVKEADMGEYVHDKSAVSSDLLSNYRTISGHYHRAQDIKCGRPRKGAVGLLSYIGSPYTITFAEANDGPKGFQVLYSDGLLEQVPTSLRKHVIVNAGVSDCEDGEAPYSLVYYDICPGTDKNSIVAGDIVWVKLKGTALQLDKVTKNIISKDLRLNHNNFKLDKIPTDIPKLPTSEIDKKTDGEILDLLIDTSSESDSKKQELKALWRMIL